MVARSSSAAAPSPSVVVLVADGARPDTLAAALDAGELPALAGLRAEGGLHTVTSSFPSVTGPAYAPFLMGRFPGPVGLPALRWYDRARRTCPFPHYTRSYVGHEMRRVDADLDPAAPTLFELAGPSLGALNVIGRGLPRRNRLGRGARFVLRAARTHFRGNVRGWLDIDREIAGELASRVRAERPRFVFAALTGIDKTSHAEGHDAPVVREAMRIVDAAAAELRADAERDGRWDGMHLWIVSDHGHSPVRAHDDLALALEGAGYGTVSHPFVWRPFPEVAVMVSGNAMAHLYVELGERERPWWPALERRWGALADFLLARESVDVMLLPHGPNRCEVRARRRGAALIERTGADRFRYRPLSGDPLGMGAEGEATGNEWYERSLPTDYPDAVVQIAHLAGSARAGEIILSAARDWDFRGRYEPIPHVSSHGALHREHMLVPLLVSRPAAGRPRRTTDVMPSAAKVLGVGGLEGLDGVAFV